jgi:hypothetical protein
MAKVKNNFTKRRRGVLFSFSEGAQASEVDGSERSKIKSEGEEEKKERKHQAHHRKKKRERERENPPSH